MVWPLGPIGQPLGEAHHRLATHPPSEGSATGYDSGTKGESDTSSQLVPRPGLAMWGGGGGG